MSIPTCDNPGLIPIDQACKQMLAAAKCAQGIEKLPLEKCLGRTIAQDLQATFDSPRFDTSMMDGYALAAADFAEHNPLPISQRIAAGDNPAALDPGTAARIFTGAPLPLGADTVVMQEQCDVINQQVSINAPVKAGQNVMYRAENLSHGQTIFKVGTRLQAHHLGIAASQGRDSLQVYKPIRVALINSGDELVMPGQALEGGQIYNSNYFTLLGLLQGLGCEVITHNILADRLDTTVDTLGQAAERADLVMTSGGVSVGDEDHIRSAVEALGSIDVWRIRIKPGKPFAFGKIGTTPFIGLPGNPVSCLVTFCLLARPYILAMQGAEVKQTLSITVRSGFNRSRLEKRDLYRAASLSGESAQLVPNQNSASLTGLLGGDGLLHLPAQTAIEVGMPLRFIPFSELLG